MGKGNNKARRATDKYYSLAKEMGYRARSAFKLIQLNQRLDFLASARVLLDLCAAPGGWLQVAVKYMPAESTIVGVDLAPIKPIRGVITHAADITTPACRALLKRDLAGKRADVVLHDGAPNVGTSWTKDAFGQNELTLSALKLATEFLRRGGTFVTKVFRSADYNALLWVFHQLFARVEATKPHSSRDQSAEIFVVCRDFKAPDRVDPKLLDARYVFKEVDDLAGTATGVAGGGGGGAEDVLHKKTDARVRQRDGYDETLGPLLTRDVPVADFIRAEDPTRLLTQASRLIFPPAPGGDAADSSGGGGGGGGGAKDSLPRVLHGHEATTEEVRDACADLKVLGKGDFKLLLVWRSAVRRSLAAEAAAARAAGAAGGGESGGGVGGDEGGDEDKEEEGGEGEEEDHDEALVKTADLALSHAAAEELARRKREAKKVRRAKLVAARRATAGMAAQTVDLIHTEEGLFDLNALLRGTAGRAGLLDAFAEGREDDGGGSGGRRRPRNAFDAGGEEEEEEEEEEERGPGEGFLGLPDGGRLQGFERRRAAVAAEAAARAEEGGYLALEAVRAATGGGEGSSLLEGLLQKSRERGLDEMEENLDAAYATALARRAKHEGRAAAVAESGKKSHGIKLSRREKLTQQALISEAAMNKRLDDEHARYVAMLAGARRGEGEELDAMLGPKAREAAERARVRFAEEEEEGEEGSGEDEEGGQEGDDGEVELQWDDEAPAGSGLPSAAASARAARWFEMLPGSQALLAAPAAPSLAPAAAAPAVPQRGAKRARSVTFEAEAGGGGGGGSDGGEEGDDDGDVFPDWMAGLPKSDREKRKDKLKKDRERRERLAARGAAAGERDAPALEIVRGNGDAGEADLEFEAMLAASGGAPPRAPPRAGDGGGERAAVSEAKKGLLRAGMGAAVSVDGGSGGGGGGGAFEVVPQAGVRGGDADSDADSSSSGSGSDSSADPRDATYDSDEHAELLALGKMLKKHTTRKALLDASYNRYAFADAPGTLPAWFEADEGRHFRPQLPISKAEVDAIKARFRDIAARPIAKVAEARARKKRRLGVALDKARAKASSIMEQEEMGARSKAKAVAKAYRMAEAKKKGAVYVVAGGGGKTNGPKGAAAKRGGKTKLVDPRMKKEKRAAKRQAKKKTGGGRRK